jgi:biotin carboxyl carrier protein
LAKEVIEVPISGMITTVGCQVGAMVKEGDVICYLESMKMENPIMAPVSGTITEIKVSPKQVVYSGDIIAIIEY